jgi:hypothetical protein
MPHRLAHATVRDGPRKVIHVVRVTGTMLELHQIDDLAGRMRERMLSKHGEQFAEVVVIQGSSRATLRMFGEAYAVSRVRNAMFHAAIKWRPIELTELGL